MERVRKLIDWGLSLNKVRDSQLSLQKANINHKGKVSYYDGLLEKSKNDKLNKLNRIIERKRGAFIKVSTSDILKAADRGKSLKKLELVAKDEFINSLEDYLSKAEEPMLALQKYFNEALKQISNTLNKDKDQLGLGIKIEMEHKETYNKFLKYYKKNGKFPSKKKFFTWIAKDHLKEDDKYYTHLIKMENENK